MNKYDPVSDSCPSCNSNNIFHYHSDYRDNKIFKCKNCCIQFMNPVYSDEHLDEYYSNYIPPELNDTVRHHQSIVTADNFNAINQIVSKGRMLDFGTGDGTHAKFAQENNWDVVAYDVDCSAMEKIKDDYGLDTYCDDFFEIDWGDKKFDLIYANQVMEHLKNPAKYVKYFYNLLENDGYIFFSVPNINSTSNSAKRFLEKLKLRNHNVAKYYDSDHHIIYYNPNSIRHLLELNKFEVVYSRNCTKVDQKKSKLTQFLNKKITEKYLATSTFLLIAKKI